MHHTRDEVGLPASKGRGSTACAAMAMRAGGLDGSATIDGLGGGACRLWERCVRSSKLTSLYPPGLSGVREPKQDHAPTAARRVNAWLGVWAPLSLGLRKGCRLLFVLSENRIISWSTMGRRKMLRIGGYSGSMVV